MDETNLHDLPTGSRGSGHSYHFIEGNVYARHSLIRISHSFNFGFNPFPNDKFRDSFKLKEFADDNFKFDENGRKFSKWLENTAGKGEIARYKQLLLFPLCFQKTCNADT